MNQFTDNTFARQPKEPMPLFDGLVNPSVLPEDELRLSGQNLAMYKRLLKGPATNVELAGKSMNTTARRSDVRFEVERFGWTLEKIESRGKGVNLYALKNADGKIVKNSLFFP